MRLGECDPVVLGFQGTLVSPMVVPVESVLEPILDWVATVQLGTRVHPTEKSPAHPSPGRRSLDWDWPSDGLPDWR